MKRAAFFLLMLLGACVSQPLTLEQVRGLSDINLCLQPQGAPFVAQETHAREINCAKIVRDEAAHRVKTANVSELCAIWYKRGEGANMDLVDREVKRRGLDCAQVVQNDREMQIMEQQQLYLQRGSWPYASDCFPVHGVMRCRGW